MASKKEGYKLIEKLREVYNITKARKQYVYKKQFQDILLTIENNFQKNTFNKQGFIEIDNFIIVPLKE